MPTPRQPPASAASPPRTSAAGHRTRVAATGGAAKRATPPGSPRRVFVTRSGIDLPRPTAGAPPTVEVGGRYASQRPARAPARAPMAGAGSGAAVARHTEHTGNKIGAAPPQPFAVKKRREGNS